MSFCGMFFIHYLERKSLPCCSEEERLHLILMSFGSLSNRVALQEVFVLTVLPLCRDVWTQAHVMLRSNDVWVVTELVWSHSAIETHQSDIAEEHKAVIHICNSEYDLKTSAIELAYFITTSFLLWDGPHTGCYKLCFELFK